MRVHQSRLVSPRIALFLLRAIAPPPGTSVRRQTSRPDQGLTLIECLVAIIIVSLTILAITPPILLSAATRIQSRRAEQANHIAQGEIDRIRTLVERGTYTINDLPVDAAVNPPQSISSVNTATVSPTSSPLLSPGACAGATRYPPATPMSVSNLARIDIDGDCTPEFMMQVFRSTGYKPTNVATDPPYSFLMMVRVYAYNPGENMPNLQRERASAVMGNTGSKDRTLDNRRFPLAVLYSPIARNDQGQSLGQLCNQARGSTTGCNF